MGSPFIVSASGVRGIAGETLTPEIARRYGAAFGTYLLQSGGSSTDGGVVLVGRDSRPSGGELAAAAGSGLRAAGLNVADVGIAPTPTVLLAVRDEPRALGGLVVTASHNPVEWNGLKLASAEGRFVAPEAGARVHEIFRSSPLGEDGEEEGRREAVSDVIGHHVDRILDLPAVNARQVAAAGLVVAVDCVRGASALILPRLLEALGCRVVGFGLEPDGDFPRDPEPVPEHLADLERLVRDEGADLGLATDPDGDRLSLVDGQGAAVGEDWTLALAAEYVLSQRKGPLVTNLSSSQCIEDVAVRAGVEFHRTPVGEAHVAARMLEVGAAVGGEGNGGVMLPDLNLTRDAQLAAALIVSLLAESGRSLEGLLAERPVYAMVKRKVPRPEGGLDALYDALVAGAGAGAEQNLSDGLRLSWRAEREWLHVRPSGTEAVLRLIAESPRREDALRLVGWAEEHVARAA